ncbi:MAG: efflux RND transporter periplasmic adaptor subunit [Salinivirgaceae bacterium]|nr:efflux RND transporter periplasmic adaptor subunit [Salinivirgaceae bacterium]
MNYKTIFTATVAAVMIVGCAKKDETTKVESPIGVTTATVVNQSVVERLNFSGTVEAGQTIPLTFEMTGTVQKVLVEAGDAVSAGQLLATIDKTDARNMYEMTLAKQKQAQDAYDRLKTVYEKGSLPEVKWIEMQTNLEQANSSLKIAENNLKKCELKSPVSGIVGRRNVEPGMSALSITGAPIEIVDLKMVNVKISIPEKEIGKLKKGAEATFTVGALGGKEFNGEVTNISPVADRLSRTYEAKIQVNNRGGELKPGMVCDVRIDIADNQKRLLLPYLCVSKDNENQQYVYLVDKKANTAAKRIVTTGNYYDKFLEITSGLNEGDLVVKNGKDKLTNNCLISF